MGLVGFDGTLNTGLTLRTVRIKDGVAEVRAGATLLYDSDPLSEEQETELKASAMLDAIVREDMEEADISSVGAGGCDDCGDSGGYGDCCGSGGGGGYGGRDDYGGGCGGGGDKIFLKITNTIQHKYKHMI